MVNVKAFSDYINSFAPYETQCSWDNCGLLVGDEGKEVEKAGICLDLTAETLAKAKEQGVDLVITHHPLIFTPQKNFLSGDKAYELAVAGISLISAHTCFDCAEGGVNDVLCELLGISNVKGVETEETTVPMVRIGDVEAQTSLEFAKVVAEKLGTVCRVVDCSNVVKKVAVCGGAGMDFFDAAVKAGADAYVTGEIKHHEMLYAKEKGVTVIEAGHFETENPSMTVLKNKLEAKFSQVEFVILEQSSPVKFIG